MSKHDPRLARWPDATRKTVTVDGNYQAEQISGTSKEGAYRWGKSEHGKHKFDLVYDQNAQAWNVIGHDQPQVQAIEISKEKLAFAKEQFAFSQEIAERQITISEAVEKRANKLWKIYNKTYLPVEKAWVAEAARGLPVEYGVDRAAGEVKRSFGLSEGALRQDMARSGIDPSSPKYAALMQDLGIARAAAEQGARTATRRNVQGTNMNLQYQAASLGKRLPSEAATMSGSSVGMLNQAAGVQGAGAAGVMGAYGSLGNMYNAEAGRVSNEAGSQAGRRQARYLADLSQTAELAGAGIGALGTVAGYNNYLNNQPPMSAGGGFGGGPTTNPNYKQPFLQ
jgi:hypothetical protein